MAVLQGKCFYPGVVQVVSATINVVHGTGPSVAVLTIAPQFGDVAQHGTLRFTFGDVEHVWPNCKVDYGSLQRNGQGQIWQLTIFDRRWKWQEHNGGNEISGAYNVWRDNFTLQDKNSDPQQANTQLHTRDTERTPQELCELCLKAMKEEDYSVSDVPNESRPAVEWDYDNPADALADLCDSLGCRVVLQLDNKVAIRQVGEGASLPTDGTMEETLTLDPPEMPDALAIVCGPTRFQPDFQLEAVGLDAPYDNVPPKVGETNPSGDLLKPINDLSYAPDPFDEHGAGGFTIADVDYFLGVGEDQFGQDVTGMRERAMASVFRYYRIKFPVRIPGYTEGDGLIWSLDQLILEDEQVNQWWTHSVLENMPAKVFGVWFPAGGDLKNTTDKLEPAAALPVKRLDPTKKPVQYERGFQIDAARGLVIFSEPVYRNAETGSSPTKLTLAPAKLVLRAACSIRDRKTGAVHRFVHKRDTGESSGSGTRYIKRDEIVLTHIPTYDASSYSQEISGSGDPRQVTKTTSNREIENGVEKQCEFHLDQSMREYQQTFPQQQKYAGIRGDIELDGAIQHVSFYIGPGGATTQAARNSEIQAATMTYRERRRNDKVRKAADEARKANSREGRNRVQRNQKSRGGKL